MLIRKIKTGPGIHFAFRKYHNSTGRKKNPQLINFNLMYHIIALVLKFVTLYQWRKVTLKLRSI